MVLADAAFRRRKANAIFLGLVGSHKPVFPTGGHHRHAGTYSAG
jgi:hypothetical protein